MRSPDRRPHLQEAIRIQRGRLTPWDNEHFSDEVIAGTAATQFLELALAAREVRRAVRQALPQRLRWLLPDRPIR